MRVFLVSRIGRGHVFCRAGKPRKRILQRGEIELGQKKWCQWLQTEVDSVRPDERRSRWRKEISSCENSELFAVTPVNRLDSQLIVAIVVIIQILSQKTIPA